MAFDAHKDFAASTVAVPPAPPASGTTLTDAAGAGAAALYPAVPCYVVICPVGVRPTRANAEIARLTNVDGAGVLTIVRAQLGTSARTILVGDQVVNAILAEDILAIETQVNTNTAGLATEVTRATTAEGLLAPALSRQIVGGYSVANLVARQMTNATVPNNIASGRVAQVAFGNMSGIRFWFLQQALNETSSDNGVIVECALEYLGVRYPMTFKGSQWGMLGRFGVLGTDPAMVDIPAGATYYVIMKVLAENNAGNFDAAGNGYTTLAATITAGNNVISLTDKPVMLGNPERMRIAGANSEVVEIWRVTGTGPYACSIRVDLAFTHNAGVLVGQGIFATKIVYSDRQTGGSDGGNLPQSDILTQTFATAALSGATTLTAGAVIGAQKIFVNNLNGSLVPGQTFTLDTAGNAETVTIRTATGVASPYTAYLVAPLTKNHSIGATLASTISINAVPAPYAVTADYYSNGVPSIVLLGDSIAQGSGNYVRTFESWATMALDANHPVLNMCMSGESAQQFAANTNGYQRRRLFDLGKWLILAYGTNDLYGGRTLAQLQGDIATIVGWARARGMKIAIPTITPRSTSTDGWETVVNQGVVNGPANTARLAFNAWARAGAGGLCDMCIEAADTIEVNSSNVPTRGGGWWKADTTVGPYCVDGLHPSYTGHQAMAAAVNPALFV